MADQIPALITEGSSGPGKLCWQSVVECLPNAVIVR